ncbi:MAG TPA: ferritin-like domain-containing protein [Opitutaceae bacterium]|nr:ferritin-like domain-containing protein [Opitutaceae bacterium]
MISKSTRLTDQARARIALMLQHVLAEESRLAARTQACAWRVRGSPIRSLKRLFSEQGRQIEHWLANLAEHARRVGLGGGVPSASEGADRDGPVSERALIGELLALHEGLTTELRTDVTALDDPAADRGTLTLFERLLEFHETTAWMLRLLLDTPEHPAAG